MYQHPDASSEISKWLRIMYRLTIWLNRELVEHPIKYEDFF